MTKTGISFPFVLLRFWFWRILWLWLVVGFFIFLIIIIHCVIMQDNEGVKVSLAWFDLMPSFIKSILGGDILEAGNITGFIAMAYEHPIVSILFMIFLVCVPTGLLTGHVQNGTMELILSRSVTKNQVYICTCFLTIFGTVALEAMTFSGTFVGISICNFEQEISFVPFARACIFGALISSTSASVALLAAVVFRTRGRAVGLAIAFLVGSDLICFIAKWWPRVRFIGPASIFYYYNAKEIFFGTGWPIRDTCVLSVVFVITVVAGGIIWNRRDLPL